MHPLSARIITLLLAPCLAGNVSVPAYATISGKQGLQGRFAEEAMANAATQQLHALDGLSRIIMGWAGKLCLDGPSGDKKHFQFEEWKPDFNSRREEKDPNSFEIKDYIDQELQNVVTDSAIGLVKSGIRPKYVDVYFEKGNYVLILKKTSDVDVSYQFKISVVGSNSLRRYQICSSSSFGFQNKQETHGLPAVARLFHRQLWLIQNQRKRWLPWYHSASEQLSRDFFLLTWKSQGLRPAVQAVIERLLQDPQFRISVFSGVRLYTNGSVVLQFRNPQGFDPDIPDLFRVIIDSRGTIQVKRVKSRELQAPLPGSPYINPEHALNALHADTTWQQWTREAAEVKTEHLPSFLFRDHLRFGARPKAKKTFVVKELYDAAVAVIRASPAMGKLVADGRALRYDITILAYAAFFWITHKMDRDAVALSEDDMVIFKSAQEAFQEKTGRHEYVEYLLQPLIEGRYPGVRLTKHQAHAIAQVADDNPEAHVYNDASKYDTLTGRDELQKLLESPNGSVRKIAREIDILVQDVDFQLPLPQSFQIESVSIPRTPAEKKLIDLLAGFQFTESKDGARPTLRGLGIIYGNNKRWKEKARFRPTVVSIVNKSEWIWTLKELKSFLAATLQLNSLSRIDEIFQESGSFSVGIDWIGSTPIRVILHRTSGIPEQEEVVKLLMDTIFQYVAFFDAVTMSEKSKDVLIKLLEVYAKLRAALPKRTAPLRVAA